jgi:hypothetical protein
MLRGAGSILAVRGRACVGSTYLLGGEAGRLLASLTIRRQAGGLDDGRQEGLQRALRLT